jgi:hypothetical protein
MNSLNRRIAIVCLFLLCLWIVALAVALFSNPPRASAAGPIRVRLTYYLWTGYPMANGEYPRPGVAACSKHFATGQRLTLPAGDRLICLDRGHIDSQPWVDVYVNNHAEGRLLAAFYGPYSVVQVVAGD